MLNIKCDQVQISSVREYLEWLDCCDVADMFRGQCDKDWQLLPSIVRYSKDIRVGYDSIKDIEDSLIMEFEKHAVPFSDLRKTTYVEKLVHAQHYGIPTRLLDWSTNPLKALYFAVDSIEHDDVDGIVYCLGHKSWSEGTKEVDIERDLVAFYPEQLNERINAQEGCFVSFPLPNKGFELAPLSDNIYKTHISNFESAVIKSEQKSKIRRELDRLGINQKTIYPGLEGVAKWVKSSIHNFTK